MVSHPSYGSNQHAFINESLTALEVELKQIGGWLLRMHGDMVSVLSILHAKFPFTELHSHVETGHALSFARDKAVKAWCDHHAVTWIEAPGSDVFRPHPVREGWSRRWHERAINPLVPTPGSVSMPDAGLFTDSVPEMSCEDLGLPPPASGRQRLSDASSGQLLDRFLRDRSGRYASEMSSPLASPDLCSRLSPHLALGLLSSRQVLHRIRSVRRHVRNPKVVACHKAFESRIVWRGHFMQRLEDETSIEHRCLDPVVDGLRQTGAFHLGVRMTEKVISTRMSAWQNGTTGFPMVDASIRSLRQTGWLNFRMRAMIVSFATYTLWLDWRLINSWLARQFTDYEPGIHLNQLQMQSGSTGLNELRIYNPVKQAKTRDPSGDFIRNWVPELATARNEVLHNLGNPRVDPEEFDLTYPRPIVDRVNAERFALRSITRARKMPESRRASKHNFNRLGSRRNRGPRRGRT
jgi:deoxyribodipyrimidine photo-lyase